MQYALLVTGDPYQSKACHSALRFIKSALEHPTAQITGVFFYQDAVQIGNSLTQPPRDEVNLLAAWQSLSEEHGVPLYLCIAAAVRRGILSKDEATRYEATQFNLAPQFQLEGLGTLVELMNSTNKVIQFR